MRDYIRFRPAKLKRPSEYGFTVSRTCSSDMPDAGEISAKNICKLAYPRIVMLFMPIQCSASRTSLGHRCMCQHQAGITVSYGIHTGYACLENLICHHRSARRLDPQRLQTQSFGARPASHGNQYLFSRGVPYAAFHLKTDAEAAFCFLYSVEPGAGADLHAFCRRFSCRKPAISASTVGRISGSISIMVIFVPREL